MTEISRTFRVDMWGKTLAVFNEMISHDFLGALRGSWWITRTAASVVHEN